VAESLIDRLATALGEAADRETDPSQQDRLRMTSRLLGDSVRAAAIEIVTGVIGDSAPA
jgi:hypothetical protein